MSHGPPIPVPARKELLTYVALIALWFGGLGNVARADGFSLAPLPPILRREAKPATVLFPYAATHPTTVLIPLYTEPDASWTALQLLAKRHPRAKITAIVNPASGPGDAADPSYARAIAALQAYGIDILGYVATTYGKRPLPEVLRDLHAWMAFYRIAGAFIDEMPSEAGFETYYAAIARDAEISQLRTIVGNPGTSFSPTYLPIFDALMAWESPGFPTLEALGAFAAYGRAHIAVIAQGVPLDRLALANLAHNAAYLYATDSRAAEYSALPSYLDALATLAE